MPLVAYRHADWPQPFPPFPPGQPGRYHRIGGHLANYWSLHPHGPWAEWLRWNGVTDPGAVPQLRRRTWAATFHVEPALIDFDAADQWGIEPEGLVSDDHSTCRELADRLVEQGITAIRVPSAALPGTENLVVFGQRVPTPYSLEPVDPTVDIPCATTSDDGHAQMAIADHVRHYGQPHVGFDAWQAGDPYTYPQP